MLVFIRRIPQDTCRAELVELIAPALKGGMFRARGEILNVTLLAMRDKASGLAEYHAVVHIKPDAAARRGEADHQVVEARARHEVKGGEQGIALRQQVVDA